MDAARSALIARGTMRRRRYLQAVGWQGAGGSVHNYLQAAYSLLNTRGQACHFMVMSQRPQVPCRDRPREHPPPCRRVGRTVRLPSPNTSRLLPRGQCAFVGPHTQNTHRALALAQTAAHPRMAAAIASAIPVLPLVASTIVSPGRRWPAASASRTIDSAGLE
jgi:hypothetical protein